MSPDSLKKIVVEEFNSKGLLQSLDIDTSTFAELPRFFEASHMSMRLVLDSVAAFSAAGNIAATLKRDLDRQGVELEYEIRARWKVVNLCSDSLERHEVADSTISDHFHVEVESGGARRRMIIHISPEAKTCILRYLAHVPAAYRQSAIHKLLETCINQKMYCRTDRYWDPVLYPSRNIEVGDVARVIESRVNSAEQELHPFI